MELIGLKDNKNISSGPNYSAFSVPYKNRFWSVWHIHRETVTLIHQLPFKSRTVTPSTSYECPFSSFFPDDKEQDETDSNITDNRRIVAALETIKYLRSEIL